LAPLSEEKKCPTSIESGAKRREREKEKEGEKRQLDGLPNSPPREEHWRVWSVAPFKLAHANGMKVAIMLFRGNPQARAKRKTPFRLNFGRQVFVGERQFGQHLHLTHAH